jgi:hypothetical protein
MTSDLALHYLEDSRLQFHRHKVLAEAAMTQLTDADFTVALDPEANSIAILVKHMAGNMCSRFTDFLTTDGEKPNRFRDQEFESTAASTKAEVLKLWEEGWNCLFAAIDGLKAEDVTRTVTIRSEPHTVLQAINRQIAHYSYHTGQIVFLAKHLRSGEWKSLSIPKGKSEEYKTAPPKTYKPSS